MKLSKNKPNSNYVAFFMQNWCISDKSAYDWPISLISSISCDAICTRNILFCIPKHSDCQRWDLNDSKCAQRPLHSIFSAFFWLRTQSYRRRSVSSFSVACYTSKKEAEISRFVIQEGRMILLRFLAANISNISSTLPVN